VLVGRASSGGQGSRNEGAEGDERDGGISGRKYRLTIDLARWESTIEFDFHAVGEYIPATDALFGSDDPRAVLLSSLVPVRACATYQAMSRV